MGTTWSRDRRAQRGTLEPVTHQLCMRLSDAQHAAYLAAGGATWLRAELDAEAERQRSAPTANRPFPPAPPGFFDDMGAD